MIRSSLRRFQFQKNGSIVPDLWEFVWDYERCYQITDRKLLSSLVSAAGFEPATHALKGRSVATPLYIFQRLRVRRKLKKTPFWQ